MNSIHSNLKLALSYHDFESMTKSEAEKIVVDATGVACPCTRDFDAPLVLNSEITDSVQRFKDALIRGKAQLSGTTWFLDDTINSIAYALPNEKLYMADKPAYWFFRHVENIYHECRHIKDFSSVFSDISSEKALFSSLLHFVASNNPGFDRGTNGTNHDLANYSHNINEIRAEIYGFSHAKTYFKSHFPSLPEEYIDSLILDIVNDKIDETDGHYCLCPGQKSHIESVSELTELIRKAVDNAYKQPFVYSFDNSMNLMRDSMARYLDNPKYKAFKGVWNDEKDPFEQIRMLAPFALNGIAKEYSVESAQKQQQMYSNLKHLNLSQRNLSDSCFRSHSRRKEALNNLEYLIGLQAYKKLPYDKNYNDDFNDFNYI